MIQTFFERSIPYCSTKRLAFGLSSGNSIGSAAGVNLRPERGPARVVLP
jgi:hypothetical protein